MRDLLFHLQRDSRTPLQTQLRELLVSAILQGQIPVGRPLPSSRKLAETLDVARNTVALAYQELVADGFLVARFCAAGRRRSRLRARRPPRPTGGRG
jgi:GntR family transcriptional regulator / MocR family aminotransferase